MTPSELMSKARTNLVLYNPFFGALAMPLKLVESETMTDTAMTDGQTVWYNPKWFGTLSEPQATGLLAHEVMHPSFLHMTRRGQRDPERWNAAADYVINPILIEAGFQLPPNGLVDNKYKGMSTDEVYDKLPKNFGKSGSSAGSGQWNWGKVVDSKGSTTQVEQEAKMRLAQAALIGKQAGKLPAGIARLVDKMLEPVIPWKEVLWRFMTEPMEADYSWNRPSRRLMAHGIYMPSCVPQELGMLDIVIAIDTSGSIDAKQLAEFSAELNGIHKQLRPRNTYVIYCDARVNHVDVFTPNDSLTIQAKGGGGTDFRPPFDYVKKHGIQPKCLVYLTDGYGPFPDEPHYPTLWAINSDVKAPFGETLPLHKS